MNFVEKYAKLLVHYSLDLKKGEKLLVRSSVLAEDLVREVFREATKIGVEVDVDLDFREKYKIFLDEASDELLKKPSYLYELAVKNFDASFIKARTPCGDGVEILSP